MKFTKRFGKLFLAVIVSLAAIGGTATAQVKSDETKSVEPEYKLQLRSRSLKPETKYTDYSIFYKTEYWKAKETAFVSVENTNTILTIDLTQRSNEVLELAKQQGSFVFQHVPSLQGANAKLSSEILTNDKIKNVIIEFRLLNDKDLFPLIESCRENHKKVVVIRDLIDDRNNKDFLKREHFVRKIEETCPTISTCDLLNKSAFRFEEDKRPHITYLVSDDHFHAEKILPVFAEYVDDHYGTYSTILHGEHTDTFTNLAELQTTDVLVVFVRRLALPKEQLEQIQNYVNSSKGGVLGIRTASHAFSVNGKVPEGHANWKEFDREVLGGNYHGHGKDALGGNVANVESLADSPLLEGVAPEKWHSSGWVYWTSPLQDKDAVVYQTSSTTEGEAPLTWTRTYKGKRVAYTALGHYDDFKIEQARRMIINLILWTAGKLD